MSEPQQNDGAFEWRLEQLTTNDWTSVAEMTRWLREDVGGHLERVLGSRRQAMSYLTSHVAANPQWYRAEPALRKTLLHMICGSEWPEIPFLSLSDEQLSQFEMTAAANVLAESKGVN